MMNLTDREAVLGRVRSLLRRQEDEVEALNAVRHRIASRSLSPSPSKPHDRVYTFRQKALALSTSVDEASHENEIASLIAAYLEAHRLPKQAVCWPQRSHLNWLKQSLSVVARPAEDTDKVGITGVICAIAETGTLMVCSSAQTDSRTSLLVETHIAVVRSSQIFSNMEEAWQCLRQSEQPWPRAVNFISGPSRPFRTADIEQTVTLGAHGPYRVHVILWHDLPSS